MSNLLPILDEMIHNHIRMYNQDPAYIAAGEAELNQIKKYVDACNLAQYPYGGPPPHGAEMCYSGFPVMAVDAASFLGLGSMFYTKEQPKP